MNKYLIVAKNTWEEIFAYRLNFIMWRFRTLLVLLGIFILWYSITSQTTTIFGYTKLKMLTYILGTSLMFSIVLAGRNSEIGDNINSGDLSIFLIRPWGYFRYWFFRDLGDKAMNLFFAVFEVALLILIFKPPLFLQTNLEFIILTLTFIILALFLNFFMSCLIGLIGFWSPEVWGPRFLFWMVISFLAGAMFPLDIFPPAVFKALEFSPFTYLLYFPLKVYLGEVTVSQIILGFFICLFWLTFFYFCLMRVWKIGLRKYGAEGR